MAWEKWITTRPPVIEALASSGSEFEIVEQLRKIAGNYGNVAGIFHPPATIQPELKDNIFLVEFETTVDALAASKGLNCPLVGFSTLIVWVPRPANEYSWDEDEAPAVHRGLHGRSSYRAANSRIASQLRIGD